MIEIGDLKLGCASTVIPELWNTNNGIPLVGMENFLNEVILLDYVGDPSINLRLLEYLLTTSSFNDSEFDDIYSKLKVIEKYKYPYAVLTGWDCFIEPLDEFTAKFKITYSYQSNVDNHGIELRESPGYLSMRSWSKFGHYGFLLCKNFDPIYQWIRSHRSDYNPVTGKITPFNEFKY